MADVYMPRNEEELAGYVKDAHAGRHPLEICGFRSKREAGRPMNASAVISAAKMSGITLYEPKELVISARAGTPLYEVEAELAKHNQELAFEPADLCRIYGEDALSASIGAIKSGGRVMKNVTGVDLVRGLSGSWGTLSVFTEVTFKVMPKAPESRTVIFLGLADEAATGVMSAAMGTPYEVSGTIHLHGALAARLSDQEIAPARTALTALRLEGAPRSLAYRVERLRRELAPFGDTYELDPQRSKDFWSGIRSLSFLCSYFDRPLWRITTAPSKAALIVRSLSAFFEVNAAYEWSGGLLWLELPSSSDASVTEVRRVLAEFDADSMLMRAPRAVRAAVEVFHPLPFTKMKIVQALKDAFDPAGVLNPGRMYAGV